MRRKTKDAIRESLALLGILIVLVWILMQSMGCRDPYLAAYQTTATARASAALAEQTLSDVCRAKADTCKASAGADADKYRACWAPCKNALESWIQYGRPAVNTALAAALASIQLAELAKQKPSVLVYLKPIACALSGSLKQWGHLLPPNTRAQIETVCNLVSLATCEAP